MDVRCFFMEREISSLLVDLTEIADLERNTSYAQNRLKRSIAMSNQLTIKGQVTIPKEIRDHLGLQSGRSAVEFVISKDGSVYLERAQSKHAVSDANPEFCKHLLGLLAGRVV